MKKNLLKVSLLTISLSIMGISAFAQPASAPTPTYPADDVMAVFCGGNTYARHNWWNPGKWGSSVVWSTYIYNDNAGPLKLDNFGWMGVEFVGAGGSWDVSAMDYLHIDIWTTNVTDFGLEIGGGTLWDCTPLKTGEWNSFDIPITELLGGTLSLTNVEIMKFAAETSTPGTVYLDNIYFYKGGATVDKPASAPTPTHPADDVMAVFCGGNTYARHNWWNPGKWGSSVVWSTYIYNDNVGPLKLDNFGWMGVEFAGAGGSWDVSAMDYLHIDIWTTNVTDFGLEIGGGTLWDCTPLKTGEWNSFDIPITELLGGTLSLTNVEIMKFAAETSIPGTVYLDNIYFYKGISSGISKLAANDGLTITGYYSILGAKLPAAPASGVFLVKYSNGKTVKFVK